MGLVFAALAALLTFIASRLDRHDRAMRRWLFGFAALNGLAFVVMLAKSDPFLWGLLPAVQVSWW